MEPLIDLLVIAAHPDDAEIGLGGTLAMFAAAGKKTAIIDLTDGEPTPYGSPEQRKIEAAAAGKILGINKRVNLELKNREISDSVEARKRLASTIRNLRPHTIFLPYWEDAHPDHLTAFNLGVAARFYSKFVKSDLEGDPWSPKQVFHYFGFHLRSKIAPSFIININDYMNIKMDALRAYHSQFVAHPGNQQILNDIQADNRYWGSRIYSQFGEPVVSREHLGIGSVAALMSLGTRSY